MIMQEYVPKEIESKWQQYWEEHNLLDFDFDSGHFDFDCAYFEICFSFTPRALM